ncbi:hypothetical protein ACE41O_12620 [Alteromonas macleodii]|uniref:hypothetical protein n=1 Tax=Alteromonas macleodii TaxID=28108 RepID=UPI00314018B6
MMTLEKFYSEFSEAHKDEPTATEWLNKYREEWMSDDQWLCALFLNRLFKGFHHIHAPFREFGRGICINTRHSYFATFDYDTLTKAVIMAHNWGIRLEVGGSGPGMIKISITRRKVREGGMSLRHPTIQEAVEKYKDY